MVKRLGGRRGGKCLAPKALLKMRGQNEELGWVGSEVRASFGGYEYQLYVDT